MASLGLGESIGHAAAEDEIVDLVHEVLDDAYLGADLAAAHDSGEGALYVLENLVDGCDLFIHKEAEHLVLGLEVVGDDGRRGVLAVCGSEGVVDIHVGVGGEDAGKLLLAHFHLLGGRLVAGVGLVDAHGLALLLGIEAEVL